MDDILVITPNGRWRAFVSELLERARHLGIRDLTHSVVSFSLGQEQLVMSQGVSLTTTKRNAYEHCLILVDEDRCSDEQLGSLEACLADTWGTNGRLMVACPSVESWMLEGHRAFSRIPQLRGVDVRRWFAETGIWPLGTETPDQPRHAIEALFAAFRIEPSNAHYRLIGRHFPIMPEQLNSSSLRQLVFQLRNWFPG